MKLHEAKTENPRGLEILSSYKMSDTDFDSMLKKLEEYTPRLKDKDRSISASLIDDIKREKSSRWANLRKWKIESILSRWKELSSAFEEFDNLSDYLVEMEDEGFKVDINQNDSIINFSCDHHPIAHLNKLFHFLNSNHRFGFKLVSLRNSGKSAFVGVEYKLRTTINTDINFDTYVD